MKSKSFDICVDGLKDYSAHRKFKKMTGLSYDGEIPRAQFATGPEGWIQWRSQFIPHQVEDMSLVENEINNLFTLKKLNIENRARLLMLYGVNTQTAIEPPVKSAPVPVFAPPPPAKADPVAPPPDRRQDSYQSPLPPKIFCSSCGVVANPGTKFCTFCGASLESAKPTIAVPQAIVKFCTRCGAKSPVEAKFCAECGNLFTEPAPIKAARRSGFCTNCGAQVEDGIRFCTTCGKPV